MVNKVLPIGYGTLVVISHYHSLTYKDSYCYTLII